LSIGRIETVSKDARFVNPGVYYIQPAPFTNPAEGRTLKMAMGNRSSPATGKVAK